MQRRQALLVSVSMLTALVAALARAPVATAQTPTADLAAIYRADVDARNRGDIAALMSHYTDDAVQVSSVNCPCVGKAAVQSQAEFAVALHTQRTIVGNPQVSGNVLTSREEHRNDRFRELGFDRVIDNLTYTFIGNKIARRVIENDLTDAQTAASVRRQATPRPAATGSLGTAGSNAPARWLVVAMVAATLMLAGGVRTATARRR